MRIGGYHVALQNLAPGAGDAIPVVTAGAAADLELALGEICLIRAMSASMNALPAGRVPSGCCKSG